MDELNTKKNQRILVIDDNPSIHEDLRKIFNTDTHQDDLDAAAASFFGDEPVAVKVTPFTIDSALQGQEGLAKVVQALAEGAPYAMAFVDVRMPPGWDGIETVARIWEVDPDLQVVICTAYSDYSWEDMIAKLGSSDRLVILKKPFDNIEALQFAHALTAKWDLLQQSKLKIENLEAMAMQRAVELSRSEERFRLIAEHASELISVWTIDGKRLYSSPSHEKMLGVPLEELCDKPIEERVHSEDAAKLLAAIQAARTSGTEQVVEFRMHRNDGSDCVLEAHANPAVNEGGEVGHLVVVARDITERTRADEERRLMEVQLRHAQKMESIGQLAAGIAHEINTPTQYIGDNTQFVQGAFCDLSALLDTYDRLLESAKSNSVSPEIIADVERAIETADLEYLTAEVPKAIEQSIQGVQQVSRIVSAMKEFSHPGTSEKTAINLNQAIESTVTVATNEWKYVANIVTDFDPTLPPVACLPGEFNQVILNIVVNASHAIGDVVADGANGKGTITITTRSDGEMAEIRIRDTGTGMPEHIQAKIFDPFFTTKGVGRGTGQGLAIAHSVIVDKHSGTIEVKSEVNRGTTFILRIPIHAASSERLAA